MNEELQQLKKRVKELEDLKASLEDPLKIPLNIDQAFRERFSILRPSTKEANSEDQSVHENGVLAYNVLKETDIFVEVVIDGLIRYIPAYTSLT